MGLPVYAAVHHTKNILTYELEVMIPVEVGEPSLQRKTLDLNLNKESLLSGLDLINELREKNK